MAMVAVEPSPWHLWHGVLYGCLTTTRLMRRSIGYAHGLCHQPPPLLRALSSAMSYTPQPSGRQTHPPIQRHDACTWSQDLDRIEVKLLQFGDALHQGRDTP